MEARVGAREVRDHAAAGDVLGVRAVTVEGVVAMEDRTPGLDLGRDQLELVVGGLGRSSRVDPVVAPT